MFFIDSIQDIWQKTVSTRLYCLEDHTLEHKLILTNQISILASLLSIPTALLFYFFFGSETPEYFISAVAAVFLTLLVPLMNYQGWINLARIWLCVIAAIYSGLLPLLGKIFFSGGDSGINIYYSPRLFQISSILIPLLLFNWNEKKPLLFCILLNLIFLIGYDPIHNLFGVGFYDVVPQMRFYYSMNFYVFVNFLFIMMAVFYLLEHNRQYEREILELNDLLNGKIKVKTKQLEQANDDLSAYNYSVTHALKTPLYMANLLLEQVQDRNNRGHLTVIGNCLKEMDQLIKNTNAFTKVGIQSRNDELLDMNELTKEVTRMLLSGKNRPNINVEPLPQVYADRLLMKQVLTNLISNAIKFSLSNPNQRIRISGETTKRETVFTVEDNGVGFDMKDYDKLVTLFESLHSKQKYNGTGVGLAIVKRIVSKYDGKLWAEGYPGRGAKFSFSIRYNLKDTPYPTKG